MALRILIIFSSIVVLNSCDFEGNIKKQLDQSFSELQTEYQGNVKTAKGQFDDCYNELLPKLKSSPLASKATDFHAEALLVSNFIDSIRYVIQQFNNNDPRSIDSISDILVNNRMGEGIISRLRQSYWLAINLVPENKLRLHLDSVRNSYSNAFVQDYFKMTTPFGATSILYEIELQLLKDGSSVICGLDVDSF